MKKCERFVELAKTFSFFFKNGYGVLKSFKLTKIIGKNRNGKNNNSNS